MYWISRRGQPTRVGTPTWWLGEVLTTSRRKKKRILFAKHPYSKPRTRTDILVRPKQRKFVVRAIKSRMIWAGHVARLGEMRGVYRVLVGKPEEKRQTGRPRRRYMIYFFNCNWVDTRWQQYSTHLHTDSTQNNTMKTEYTEQSKHNNTNTYTGG